LEFAPWKDGISSDEICPCCGIQYGYDDAAGGDNLKRSLIYNNWRERWIKGGMIWQSKGITPPKDWNGFQQIKNLR
jgi:hypothetical protein